MKCQYCNDTGKYKQPKDREEFDRLVDLEMEKGDFASNILAERNALKKVGFTMINCPYCHKDTQETIEE